MDVQHGWRPRGAMVMGLAVLASAVMMVPSAQAIPFDAGGNGVVADNTANYERMLRQQPLIKAADQIRTVVERGNHRGYAGIILEDRHVALWWKGVVPQAVRDAVAGAESTAPVHVERARYSLAELRNAAQRVRSKIDAASVHTVRIPSDGRGLELVVRPGSRASAMPFADDQRRAGVAVEIVEEVEPRQASREDDWSPWHAGAETHNATASTGCTSGFGVRDASGAAYVSTAAHCGAVGDHITDAQGESIGDTAMTNEEHDVGLIATSDVENFMYVGDMGSNEALAVTGWSSAYPGQIVCHSGVTSEKETGGPVCNIEVVNVNHDASGMVEADQLDGQEAARPGDSGGPVYGIAEDGSAVAVGITSAVAGSRLVFQDFVTVMEDFGVGI